MTNITRRDFLKGTLAGAAALSLTGLGVTTGSVNAEAADAPATTDLPLIPAWTQMNPQADDLENATTDFKELFSPIQVGPMKLRNRIIKSAAGSDTLPRTATEMAQNTIDYYGRFADGGAALVILEDGVTGKFGINQ
ncbi:MAG: twin-arginine translocation signal domain-containing protein, partial [Oscillospiraceae bacterium]|nr:twin-arginine translocation signal domain-containing protein [Oscillospiraceae bacterium]